MAEVSKADARKTKKTSARRARKPLEKKAKVAPEPTAASVEIPLSQISAGQYQPRSYVEANIEELAAAIRRVGLLNPVTVVKDGDRYKLIAGERRLLACRKLEWKTIPAHVLEARIFEKERGGTSPEEVALIENIQREDLSAIDEAKAYQKLLKEYEHTQLQLAQRLGKSQSYIAEMLGLLELDARVQDLVNQGRIGSSMARQIARLPDKDAQHQAALSVVTGSMTVVQAKELVDQILGKKAEGAKKGGKAKGRTTLRLNTLRRAEKHVAAIAGGLKALSPKTVKPADRPKIKELLEDLRKALASALEQLGAE